MTLLWVITHSRFPVETMTFTALIENRMIALLLYALLYMVRTL